MEELCPAVLDGLIPHASFSSRSRYSFVISVHRQFQVRFPSFASPDSCPVPRILSDLSRRLAERSLTPAVHPVSDNPESVRVGGDPCVGEPLRCLSQLHRGLAVMTRFSGSNIIDLRPSGLFLYLENGLFIMRLTIPEPGAHAHIGHHPKSGRLWSRPIGCLTEIREATRGLYKQIINPETIAMAVLANHTRSESTM